MAQSSFNDLSRSTPKRPTVAIRDPARPTNGLRGCGAMMRRMPLPSSENSASSSEPWRNRPSIVRRSQERCWSEAPTNHGICWEETRTWPTSANSMALWLIWLVDFHWWDVGDVGSGPAWHHWGWIWTLNCSRGILVEPLASAFRMGSAGRRQTIVPVDPAFFHGCCLFNCRNRLHSLVLKENLHQKLCLFYSFPMVFHVCSLKSHGVNRNLSHHALLEVWTWLILKKKLGSKHVPQATLCLLQAHPGPTGWSVSTKNIRKWPSSGLEIPFSRHTQVSFITISYYIIYIYIIYIYHIISPNIILLMKSSWGKSERLVMSQGKTLMLFASSSKERSSFESVWKWDVPRATPK